MTPKQMAHEFFLGIRQAMTCPDVSVAEYENVMACKIESALRDIEEQTRKEAWMQGESAVLQMCRTKAAAIKAEGEACAKVADFYGSPHIAEAIRKRGNQ